MIFHTTTMMINENNNKGNSTNLIKHTYWICFTGDNEKILLTFKN